MATEQTSTADIIKKLNNNEVGLVLVVMFIIFHSLIYCLVYKISIKLWKTTSFVQATVQNPDILYVLSHTMKIKKQILTHFPNQDGNCKQNIYLKWKWFTLSMYCLRIKLNLCQGSTFILNFVANMGDKS